MVEIGYFVLKKKEDFERSSIMEPAPPSYDLSNNLYNQPSSSLSATNAVLVENEKTMAATSDAMATEAAAGSSTAPAKKEVKKSRKPRDTALTQQRLKAWQPILSPPWVIASFLIIFVVFTALGILLILTSESVCFTIHKTRIFCHANFFFC